MNSIIRERVATYYQLVKRHRKKEARKARAERGQRSWLRK